MWSATGKSRRCSRVTASTTTPMAWEAYSRSKAAATTRKPRSILAATTESSTWCCGTRRSRSCRPRRCCSLAVLPGLGARAADLHAAPAPVLGRGPVIESPLAVTSAADFEPRPGPEGCCLGGDQHEPSEASYRAEPSGCRCHLAIGADLQLGRQGCGNHPQPPNGIGANRLWKTTIGKERGGFS